MCIYNFCAKHQFWIIEKKMIKFLHMSEKSSTFATDFERKGTIKTTPDSLTCVRDYREFRCKSTTFF